MRPAWMKPSRGCMDSMGHEESSMLGAFDKSIWHEQKYSRSLLLQAKQKILRGKAYEVPEEMMTMTTGIRPKWKPEKREKDARAASPEPELVGPLPESPALGPQSAPAAVAESKDQEVETTLKKSKSSTTSPGGLYENMPGDSK